MQKKVRKQKRIHIALQITVLLCGVFFWYGNSVLLPDPQNMNNEWGAQLYSVIENSDHGIDADSGENIHRTSISSTSSLTGEETSLHSTGKEIVVEMSAYTSRVEETDDSPCISADGTNICEYDGCVLASNDFEFGTKVEVDGFGECEVKDRMNSRYNGTGNMDIYFKMDLEGALEFGRKQVKIEITS